MARLFDFVFLDFVSNRWDLWGWNNKSMVSRNTWFVHNPDFEIFFWLFNSAHWTLKYQSLVKLELYGLKN